MSILGIQLEDRMITIHPNTTAEQTRDIISRTAEMASGNGDGIDQKTLDAWKLFYESLESVPVVIPYARDIAEFINRTGSLPISSRHAFKRVLATIKTIALILQKQRSRNDMWGKGRCFDVDPLWEIPYLNHMSQMPGHR